jgi:O-antigen ligase
LAHKLLLILVALTIGSGAIVFSEPAPVDALMIGLIVLLPAAGLANILPGHVLFLSAWLVIAASAFISSILATDTAVSTTHTAISLYLAISAFVMAGFVAKNPVAHARLVLNAYTVGAVIAALIGVAGYFDAVPGAAELFTKFGRAAGPFKDPNVFGAFLVLAAVKTLHDAVTGRGLWAVVSFLALGLLMFAALLSFSRGAWGAMAIAVAIYSYLSFVTSKRNIERLKLLSLGCATLAAGALVMLAALQSDMISDLLEERASLSQSYDVGPDGRFGGQEKARALIVENPLGIGALSFARAYHNEDVHNVYLTMFLNAGWLGGFLYLVISVLTVIYGLRHAFRRTASQPYFLIAYAALTAIIFEGIIIDTDHWRHYYLLMGLVWGLMIADRTIVRSPRIVADRRPILLKSMHTRRAPRRQARSLIPVRIALPDPHPVHPFTRRPARIRC